MRDPDLRALYEAYAGTVYRFLFCLTHDRFLAEELTQETFLAALHSVGKFRGECQLRVWLCQIARHLWYRELKRRRRAPTVPLEEALLLSHEDVESALMEKEEKAELRRRIAALDENTRQVMLFRLTGEMSFEEIGELMGRSAGWARVTFYRGKEKIAKEWRMDE